MRKYFLFVIAVGLMGAMTFTSCKKESEATFPLNGTVWMASELYDLKTNQYYNGDVMYIMKMAGEGSGTGSMMTINNHTSRAAIDITTGSPVTWTLSGSILNLITSTQTLKGDLSYSNRNVNFIRPDATYLAFDQINLTNSLSTKVFRGTFKKVGTTTTTDCVWIFLSGKGWKMIVPGYPVTIYPLSKYTVDNAGKVIVNFFGGTASAAVPIDYVNHSGTYTASNDSLIYTSTSVPAANAYPNSYNWRGVFRLKEVK